MYKEDKWYKDLQLFIKECGKKKDFSKNNFAKANNLLNLVNTFIK